jgi:uncharacterized protein YcfJ
MTTKVKSAAVAVLTVAMGISSVGCETKAQTGALAGGLGGAAIGGLIGSHHRSSAGAGAAIGAGVGAIGGYLVGNEADKRDQRKREQAAAASANASSANAYPAPAPRTAIAAESAVTRDDVIRWSRDGVKDEIIIDRIERSGSTFRLSAADETSLRDSNVSEEVVRAMKRTVR